MHRVLWWFPPISAPAGGRFLPIGAWMRIPSGSAQQPRPPTSELPRRRKDQGTRGRARTFVSGSCVLLLLLSASACNPAMSSVLCSLDLKACSSIRGFTILCDRGGSSRCDPDSAVVRRTIEYLLDACLHHGGRIHLHDVGETLDQTEQVASLECGALKNLGDLRSRPLVDSVTSDWIGQLEDLPDRTHRRASPLVQSLVKASFQARDFMRTSDRWVFVLLSDGLQYGPFRGPEALQLDMECGVVPPPVEFSELLLRRYPQVDLTGTITYVVPHEIGRAPPGDRCEPDMARDLAVRAAWGALGVFGGEVVVRSEPPQRSDLEQEGG